MREDTPDTTTGEPGVEPLGSLFSRLIHDIGAVLRAEMDLYRSLALQRFVGSRIVVFLAAGGLLLIFGSFTAMMTGFVLALAHLIGPLGAALVVGLGGALIGLLLIYLAGRKFRQLGESDDEDEA